MNDEERKNEERRKLRDQMDNETRRKFFEASHDQAILQLLSGTTDEVSRQQMSEWKNSLTARLEQIEKRLETLELKQ